MEYYGGTRSDGIIHLQVEVPTGIEEMEIVRDGVTFNLTGQRVTNPTSGLYIRNGRKYLIK